MITQIQSLQGKCSICGIRADFQITKTNDDLPKGYCRDGVRAVYYCKACMPQECKDAWNMNIPDMPNQQL